MGNTVAAKKVVLGQDLSRHESMVFTDDVTKTAKLLALGINVQPATLMSRFEIEGAQSTNVLYRALPSKSGKPKLVEAAKYEEALSILKFNEHIRALQSLGASKIVAVKVIKKSSEPFKVSLDVTALLEFGEVKIQGGAGKSAEYISNSLFHQSGPGSAPVDPRPLLIESLEMDLLDSLCEGVLKNSAREQILSIEKWNTSSSGMGLSAAMKGIGISAGASRSRSENSVTYIGAQFNYSA